MSFLGVMAKSVVVSSVQSHGLEDQQQCLIPSQLLSSIKVNVGSYVNINLSENSSLTCRAVPMISLCSEQAFQVIACDCVSRGCSKDLPISGSDIKIDQKDIIPLKPVELNSVTVVVIVKSVENVLNYRRQKKSYEKCIHRLLKQYRFRDQSRILCKKNPVAKLIGVSEIRVVNCSLQEGEIGVATSDTDVKVDVVESEDRIKLSAQKTVNLGGLDNILQYLRLLITEPWARKKEFGDAGVVYPSGVLLVGPPGCGKTSIVRQLCSETGACLIATTGADVISPYEGETEEKLLKVAERAQLLSEEGPCVFFIDEIDSLCPMRTKESSLFNIKLAALVLLIVDKCQICSNLTLMAATNRPYDLDPALRRSGRFEVEILLNVPTDKERESILATHCEDLLPLNHPGLETVAHATPGFVGADLKALCETTALKIEEERKDEAEVAPERIVEVMLACASGITPSIHKNLEFITAKPKVSSIGGLKEVKQKLEQIFMHHAHFAEAYDKLKLKRPKGVLLYGPRGCGKTRLVASMASARGCTFLTANASHLLSPYVGDSEKRVAALFHAAHLAQPTILFIDEIDGIFRSRDGKTSNVHVSILNELLQAMDGANVNATAMQGASYLSGHLSRGKDRVLVCAATNRPNSLDPALLRPGRFDRLVYVPPPDFEARLDILKIKTRKTTVTSPTVLETIAQKTHGFTGAELEHLVTKAVVSSIKENLSAKGDLPVHLEERHLMDALQHSSPAVTDMEIKVFEEFSLR